MASKRKIIDSKNIVITEVEADLNFVYLEWGEIRYCLVFSDGMGCWFFDISESFEMLSDDDIENGYETKEDAIEILKQRIAKNINEACLDS